MLFTFNAQNTSIYNNHAVKACKIPPAKFKTCHLRCSASQQQQTTQPKKKKSRFTLELTGDPVPFSPNNQPKAQAHPHKQPPILILPGFGNNSIDYTCPFGDEDRALATALKSRGFRVYCLPLERLDWIKVGKMIFSLDFWKTKCTVQQGYNWYLQSIHNMVEMIQKETGGDCKVDIVAHSAGGWLARAYIAGYTGSNENHNVLLSSGGQGNARAIFSSDSYDDANCSDTPTPQPHPAIRALVTLGTPHSPPLAGTIKDRTGGALTWLDTTFPGAFFKDQGVRYISVGGSFITGNKDQEKFKTLAGYAHDSYYEVCGQGQGVDGDAIVPLCSALLDGANEQVVLPGVVHSMSRIGNFEEAGEWPWYGDDEVVDSWLKYLVVDG
jgi:pimeloyl-ACP methyl ester carboxylesterase